MSELIPEKLNAVDPVYDPNNPPPSDVTVPPPVAQPAPVEIPASAPTLASVIQNLHGLMDQARLLISHYNVKHSAVSLKDDSITQRTADLDAREKSLVEREKNCQTVENAQDLYKKSSALMDSANSRLNAATEAEQKLKVSTQQETDKLSELRLLTQKEASAVDVQRKSIDDEVSKRVNAIMNTINKPAPATVDPTVKVPDAATT